MKRRNVLLAFVWMLVVTVATPRLSTAQMDYSTGDRYLITLLRAAPGNLAPLIDDVRAYKAELAGDLIIMRHSQGDHWDLMLLRPVGSSPFETRSFGDRVSFQNDFVAESNWNWDMVQTHAVDAGLFHVEMFQAAHGQHQALLKEREMENAYLVATGRNTNAIFVTLLGSDVDSFTIGFYKDMVQFATDPDLSEEQYQKAATEAGFASRADIGIYLRQFLAGHNDTLASQIR